MCPHNSSSLEETQARPSTHADYLVLTIRTIRPPYLRPVLGIRSANGAIVIPPETILWTRSIARVYPVGDAFKMLSTLGRLHQYASICFNKIGVEEANLLLVIWNYLAFRMGDRQPEDPDVAELPDWAPISEGLARDEFRTILSFLKFCSRTLGHLPTLATNVPLTEKAVSSFKYNSSEDRDFFFHLQPHRARWREFFGVSYQTMPHVGHRIPPNRSSAIGTTMPADEVKAIIAHEENVVFRALWKLLAFGGIRVSEALNLWSVDIMPGRTLRYFARDVSMSEPLVMLAHPIQSRYTGDIRGGPLTRNEVLHQTYGLKPRPLYPPKHTMRAGWKGIAYRDPQLKVSWVYWSNPVQAQEFSLLASSVFDLQQRYQTSERHPYFFINMSNDARLGEPLKYGNAQKAFERACRRVGLEPHIYGRHLHGFRHFYKATLANQLKISREYRQIMLHHRSENSQDDYDRLCAEAHSRLRDAYDGINAL